MATEGLLEAVLAPICWGSWPAGMRLARRKPPLEGGASFAAFYYIYSVAIMLVLATSARYLNGSFADLWEDMALERASLSLAAGAIWQMGNILLAVTTQVAGPGFAFCSSCSISISLGTCLTYLIEPKGNPYFLLGGVLCALCAVVLIFKMHKIKDRALKRYRAQLLSITVGSGIAGSPTNGAPPTPATPLPVRMRRKVVSVLSVVSGLCIGSFNPVNTLALKSARSGEADRDVLMQQSLLWLGVGIFLSCQVTVPVVVLSLPDIFKGDSQMGVSSTGFCRQVCRECRLASVLSHLFSFLAGACWAAGFLGNLFGGRQVGYALAFALSQTCPLVATLWGAVAFGEFSGDWIPSSAKLLLFAELVFYVAAVVCIVMSSFIDGHREGRQALRTRPGTATAGPRGVRNRPGAPLMARWHFCTGCRQLSFASIPSLPALDCHSASDDVAGGAD
eukprot:CAMPEP_0197879940 /NCGR_PEP_ID=MMETSP1439-20131203/7886_1 /TAXON_ID=66791 /ORGANISM="Gonyaulax spinifera, Strain CCMP409" /LENGTH=448 /DNA_ID=CAMNT_0043499477 /DNA_START=47 /DNA_END=1391 /DNA_ORIENTATION=+